MADYNIEAEKKWLDFWEKEKIYKFDFKKKKKIYSIDTPPPTVSGKMHIGHAFSYSQQDFIARFHRMKENVFYPFGTDDNGLPTERLIEKTKKVNSKQMSRQDFINLCLKTLKEITPDFIEDWKRIGISADYNLYYSTIDKNSQKISQKSFIELFNKKHIYIKKFPSIWCTECQTAIAQAELEDKEKESLFSTIKFSCEGKELKISTTRPELLPACVAVFVNPQDKRYNSIIGKKAKIPLFDYEVPIIADSLADIDKGTGVLMVCSYGDKFDVNSVNKYKLEPRIIIKENGMLDVKGYENLNVKEARKKILNELNEKNLIVEQKNIVHAVNVHDKCGNEIEFLPTEQWFIKILDKKKKLLEQGKKIKWKPEFMHKRYENWVNGLEWDWNISRERHFGIPIPAWHCRKCNEIIVADEKELPIDPLENRKKCPKCKSEAEPEKKVLDTWATSSLTPQITSSLIGNKIKIPYSLRPQAHEIIRTWTFYTIAKSLLHENEIPWKNVMVSGFVTLEGEKMAKSKGNVIAPQEVIEKYGADALRFWAAGSKLGEDLDYQEKDLVTGKKFITKLFNASKFVFMNLEDYNIKRLEINNFRRAEMSEIKDFRASRKSLRFSRNQKDFQAKTKLEKTDELFLEKLNSLIKNVTEHFENYEYSKAKSEIENFFWHVFADNYLEIVKYRIYSCKGQKKESAQYVLYVSLLNILKMTAPIMPFITEELYQSFFRKFEKEKSIHLCEWPEFKKEQKTNELDLFFDILSKVRQEKTKFQKSLKTEIILTLEKEKIKKLKDVLDDLKSVTNAKEIKEGKFSIQIL